jgi:hypothetical protein
MFQHLKKSEERLNKMSVSKKDFIAIAEILAKDTEREEIINSVVAYFKSENPLFNEKRFREHIKKRSA